MTDLEKKAEQTWTTEQLREDFDLSNVGFSYGVMVDAVRKADGVRGSLLFGHAPRIYYGFTPSR